MKPITDHLYDCGPVEEKGGPCIATVSTRRGAASDPWTEDRDCGQPREAHERTEYDRNPGDMHEPKPYPAHSLSFDRDDDGHLHPYID